MNTNSVSASASTPGGAASTQSGAASWRVIWLSVAAALVTVALKLVAYFLTGSVGVLSDAVESCVNVVAACTAAFALWFAAQPADRSHPYGHEKIEFFSSGVEGGLIVVAAIAIAVEAARRLAHPAMPHAIGIGIFITLLTAALNYAVARSLLSVARRTESLALEADGHIY